MFYAAARGPGRLVPTGLRLRPADICHLEVNMARSIVGRLVAALALAASATVAQAQSSTLSGKVTDGEKGTPIGGEIGRAHV